MKLKFQNSIVRKQKQGRPGLEGEQAREFTNLADDLSQKLEKEDIEAWFKAQPCVATLRAFNKVKSNIHKKFLRYCSI